MQDFIRGLFAELEGRCGNISDRASAQTIHSNARDQALLTYTTVVRCRTAARDHRESSELSDPANTALFLRRYRALSREVQIAETIGLVFAERHQVADQRLTALVRRFVSDAKLPILPPLAAGFSSEYYWANKDYHVIAFPATEEAALLGLPDMVHEIGHLVSNRHLPKLIRLWLPLLAQHFDDLVNRAPSGEVAQKWKTIYGWWRDRWTEEFCCDILATYLVGPCYGWQNLRLTIGDITPYESSWSHPADDARLFVIEASLKRLSGSAAADAQRLHWDAYVSAAGASPPLDFDDTYPAKLLDELVEAVLAWARAEAVRSFADYPAGQFSIPHSLDEAWRRQLQDAATYWSWQHATLADMWAVLREQSVVRPGLRGRLISFLHRLGF